MTNEELEKLREAYKVLESKRNKVLVLKKEIEELEKIDIIKKYNKLIDDYSKMTSGANTGIDEYTDDQLISIALNHVKITPDKNIYVYIGSYRYNREIDIIHGSSDYEVSRNSSNIDYVIYENLESIYNSTIEVPYHKVEEFERTHNVIFPKNVLNYQYFYKLQLEYFKTMILSSREDAIESINKLIKK